MTYHKLVLCRLSLADIIFLSCTILQTDRVSYSQSCLVCKINRSACVLAVRMFSNDFVNDSALETFNLFLQRACNHVRTLEITARLSIYRVRTYNMSVNLFLVHRERNNYLRDSPRDILLLQFMKL